ncbi:GPI transamidase component PIG-T-like [Ornithodoros turicata]|uniref:GPI transamidase component PIG-T-like n=1 Tax=Ornithodoros turicata TaxID=34597 RepID=UPI00313929AE
MATRVKMLWCTLCFINLFAAVICAHKDSFTEELFIQPLPSGHVYNYFLFTTRWEVDRESETFQHYRLFPLSLGEIIRQNHVQELHLALTQGRWQHRKWGYPFQDAPPGAHIWTWFKESAPSVDGVWKNLTNALSGQLCASLNFVEETVTVNPKRTLRPQGWVSSANNSLLRYAMLPRESVCTENLTPWTKLLPCGTKVGLGTLLHALQVFTANYLSLAVDFKHICQDAVCTQTTLELQLSISLVFDTVASQKGYQSWSLSKLFGSGLRTTCPLSSMSAIYVETTSNGSVGTFKLSPPPVQVIASEAFATPRTFAVYDLKAIVEQGRINLVATYAKPHIFWITRPPPVHITRYVQGYGLERGGITSHIHNEHPTQPLKIVYVDIVPWFLRVYIHTLKVVSRGKALKPENVFYEPGQDRRRSHHLELTLELPPSSKTTVSFEFDRAFLKWTEYPPDANHGFYVGSAILNTVFKKTPMNYSGDVSLCPTLRHCLTGKSSEPGSTESYFLRLYTETLLVSLPTPDFSMPYNVICLACTVVALAFGPIHNITTNALVAVEVKKAEERSLVGKLKAKLRKLLGRKNEEQQEQTIDSETESKKEK